MAVAPVQPTISSAATPSHLSHISFQSVNLAATANPITAILDVWNTSETAFAALVNQALSPPMPILQQVGANWLRYGSEVPDFSGIINSVVTNLQAALQTPFAVDTSTLTGLHPTVWSLLPSLITIPPALQPVLDFTTTYTSGVLIGLVGPIVAPIIAFGNSLQAALTALTTGELVDAINEIINIPANMVNAFLNGGKVLDLTPVLKNILPSELTSAGIMMGGLLSPGGSLFNALDLVADLGFGPPLDIPGTPAGTIGSLMALGGAIAKAIGWSGTGNPLHPGIPVPGAAAVAASAVAAPEAPAVTRGELAAPAGDTSGADDAPASVAASSDSGPAGPAASGKGAPRPSKKSNPSASSVGSGSSAADDGAAHGKGSSKRAKAGRDNAA